MMPEGTWGLCVGGAVVVELLIGEVAFGSEPATGADAGGVRVTTLGVDAPDAPPPASELLRPSPGCLKPSDVAALRLSRLLATAVLRPRRGGPMIGYRTTTAIAMRPKMAVTARKPNGTQERSPAPGVLASLSGRTSGPPSA
jgi:hypothetical protein